MPFVGKKRVAYHEVEVIGWSLNTLVLVSKHGVLYRNIALVKHIHSDFDELLQIQLETIFLNDLTDLESENSQLRVLDVIQLVVSRAELAIPS